MNSNIHIGYLTFANDYLEAYEIIQERFPDFTKKLNVKSLLFFHAFELTFKSYLLYRGYTANKLKKFGHDLGKLLNELERNSFNKLYTVDKELKIVINHMNQFYKTKQFEYLTPGYKTYSDYDKHKGVLKYMISKLKSEYRTSNKTGD